MKLINGIGVNFNALQGEGLDKQLEKDLGDKKITYKSQYKIMRTERLANLKDKLTLNRVMPATNIDDNLYKTQVQDIDITMETLKVISDKIKTKIGIHEAIYKDINSNISNILKANSDFLENTITDFIVSNVIINKEGEVELFPIVSEDYQPMDINVTYYPDDYIVKTGNDPTIVNLSEGTNTLYWVSEIYMNYMNDVKVKMELDYGVPIKFNTISLNSVSEYPVIIENIETYGDTGYTSIPGYTETTGKKIFHDLGTTYNARKIRLTIRQEIPTYIERKELNNNRELYDIEPTNLVREDMEDEVRDRFITTKELNLNGTKEWERVYKYVIGLYNIKLSYKLYSEDGTFISKPYKPINESIDTIRITTDEVLPSDTTITYSVQEHGKGTYVENSIDVDTVYIAAKRWHSREAFTNKGGNKLTIKSAPVIGEEQYPVNVYVDGRLAKSVIKLNNSDNTAWKYQYIIKDNKLFFNIGLPDHDVLIDYYHYSDFIKIKAVLNTGVTYNVPYSPKLTNIDVYFNDSALNKR